MLKYDPSSRIWTIFEIRKKEVCQKRCSLGRYLLLFRAQSTRYRNDFGGFRMVLQMYNSKGWMSSGERIKSKIRRLIRCFYLTVFTRVRSRSLVWKSHNRFPKSAFKRNNITSLLFILTFLDFFVLGYVTIRQTQLGLCSRMSRTQSIMYE